MLRRKPLVAWILGLSLLATLVLGSAAASLAADNDPADEYLFYPLPPNQPRLQFLASFSSVLDVSAKKQRFRDFVFGGAEHEGHLIEKPYGVAIYEGAIYVIDTRGFGWGVFDLANKRSKMVRPGGGGSLKKPINITIDDDGTRYITDTGREQVLVFDADDRFRYAFGKPGQFRPIDVALADDRIFVTDILHHQVHVLDKRTGDVLMTFGEVGSDPGQLFHPTNLTVSPEGTLYVVDTGNFRIQEFTTSGDFVRAFGHAGTGPGSFSRPKGVSVDKANHIYVVDAAFENVQILDQAGGALMHFGNPGASKDSINLPTVVKIDYDNVPYFEKYVAPDFSVEYLVIVASQFGANKVTVFGFGAPLE